MAKKQNILLATIGNRDLAFQVSSAAIQAYFKSAIDRNQLFHGLTGLTKLDLF